MVIHDMRNPTFSSKVRLEMLLKEINQFKETLSQWKLSIGELK
jgi:hypothetical protein